jgi:hypothetical protein
VNSVSVVSGNTLVVNVTVAPDAALGFVDVTATTAGLSAAILNGLQIVAASPACSRDVTSDLQVARGGYRRNAAGRWLQTVRITNKRATAIAGPVRLVLDSLSSNSALFNSAGVTACALPPGSPVRDTGITAASGLAPGAAIDVLLEFTNPTNAGITYNLRALGGPGDGF